MKVTLTQSLGQRLLQGWILIRLESSDVCTQIWTSNVFDPYREIYIWLGQIRDSQLPAKMIIDEEGRGVELIVERANNNGILHFHIEPWFCGNDCSTVFSTEIQSNELVGAFCNGIIEFVRNDYQPSKWSYGNNLSNLNWEALLNPTSIPSQKWQTRLAMYGGGHGRVPDTGRKTLEQRLTTEQQWLIILHDVLFTIALLAIQGNKNESFTLVDLYQNLLIDLALNEFEPSWYEKRRAEIEREIQSLSTPPHYRRIPERVRRERQARLSTLKLGQLVDGRVRRIRPYGIFVDIVGLTALLTNATISQLPVEHPDQVFQVDDWVRAMIVALDVEKGRVSLSTSDLEPEPGDMLRNPLSVYERAEEMANRYRQNVLSNLNLPHRPIKDFTSE